MNTLEYVLALIGGWLILDGAVSLYLYQSQSLPEQAVRVVRTAAGIFLVGAALHFIG